MNLKVSLIVIVDEFNEKFLEDCLYSLINQSLNEIEIICVSSYPNKIIENFSKKDERIKSIVSDENLKFEGLKQASGEYLSFINSNDWIDFDFCEILYTNAKDNNSDILLYKLLRYNNGNWFDDYYYNFFNFEEKFFNESFSHKDIQDILFSIPPEVYNKFFKNNFSIEFNPFFNNNLIFEDVPFFFKVFLESKRISLCDEFIYFKRDNINSNLINNDILINVIDCTNDLISIFKNSQYYEFYEKQVWNYKFDLIRFWYFSVDKHIQENSINYLYDDFKFMVDNFLPHFEKILKKQNLFFYKNIQTYHDVNIINKIYENNNLKYFNGILLKEKEDIQQTKDTLLKEKEDIQQTKDTLLKEKEDIQQIKNAIQKENNEISEYKNLLQIENSNLKKSVDELSNKNNDLTELSKKQNILINKQNEELYFLNKNNIILNSKLNKSKSNSSKLFNKFKKNL